MFGDLEHLQKQSIWNSCWELAFLSIRWPNNQPPATSSPTRQDLEDLLGKQEPELD